MNCPIDRTVDTGHIISLPSRRASRHLILVEISSMSSAPADSQTKARFTTGSTMRHVLVMCSTGSIGLVSIFLVDFANLFYISLLGDPMLTAAVGFAGTVLYFHMSFALGLMIAAVALTSRALGAGDQQRARQVAGSALAIVAVFSGGLTLISMPLIDWMLGIVGATGETQRAAAWFMLIALPTTPLFGGAMCLVGILRSAGDAKRAMYSTLILGLVTAILDPILIYGLNLGLTGAAIVMVISRVLTLVYAFGVATRVHRLIARPTLPGVKFDFPPLARIGVPAVLTGIAIPVSNGYVTAEVAVFGDDAVAGWAIISRLVPLAFGFLFAMSGAIGPIIGQNFGAHAFDRVRRTIADAMIVTTIYTIIVSMILFLGRDAIVASFSVSGEAAELIIFFCTFLAISYIFSAGLFVSNAAFNNLGFPLLSTLFNWGRATLGTIPFVWVGANIAGAAGALAGFAIGAIPFGIGALFLCRWIIARLETSHEKTTRMPFWWTALSANTEARSAPRG